MRSFILFLMVSSACLAAPTATITGITAQQAVLQIGTPAGSCLIELSTSASYSPVVPDVDPALYSGSNTDTSRPDTITWADGTRIVTLGHRLRDRSLSTMTLYYYRVSGCGGTVTGNFTTSNIGNGMTLTGSVPYDATSWGHMGYPPIDWTTIKSYTDPMSGAILRPLSLVFQTWRTGGGSSGPISSTTTFSDFSGGSGWTSPGSIVNGLSTSAVTGNTNPIDLFADWSNEFFAAYDYHRVLEDIGTAIWGQGSGAPADRGIHVSLISHGVTCGSIAITLPTGSAAAVSSGSGDPDQPFPIGFPANAFTSWSGGTSSCLHNEDMQTGGTVNVIPGGQLTITTPTAQDHFSTALVSGDKIFLSNSSPGCTNNLCTVLFNSGPGIVLLVESPSALGPQTYRAYGWSIRISKDNTNGTITIGAKYKLAGTIAPPGVQAGGNHCSSVSQTSSDGKIGYICQMTSIISGFQSIYFIANDGTARLIYDQLPLSANSMFDPVLGNVFYVGFNNSGGGKGINKYTYTGNYSTSIDYAYGCASSGTCPTSIISAEQVTITDLMPNGSGQDLNQQIQSHQGGTLAVYNTSLYRAWTAANGNVGAIGGSGRYYYYQNVYSGQGNDSFGGPGWIAVVDITPNPAQVVSLIHTLDGTGCSNCRFGSMHSIQPQDSAANLVFDSLDTLYTRNSSVLHGGPFETTPDGVLLADGVTWDANTCLDWPANSGTGCAHRGTSPAYTTCPIGTITYIDCAVLRMELPGGKVPNKNATAAEIAAFPCSGAHPTWACPVALSIGDNAVDLMGSSGGTDNEHFRPLAITQISGDSYRVDIARNAVYDYCSKSPWHGQTNALSAQSDPQLQHSFSWTFTMAPGHRAGISNSCGSAQIIQDSSTAIGAELGHSLGGHFKIGPGPTIGNLSFVTSPYTAYNQPISSIDQVPPALSATPGPSFHGNNANVGASNGLQSYPDISQYAAGASNLVWSIDVNGLLGCAAEVFGCGPVVTITPISGDIYKISLTATSGITASESSYKVHPLIGPAGTNIMKDISGPGSSVDVTPYSMCIAISSGECHAGSSSGEIYFNVPKLYNPGGFYQPSQEWSNNVGVFMGYDAPGAFLRQFRISVNDSTGAYSRGISGGMSSFGRQWPYSTAVMHPSGLWSIIPANQYSEGHGLITWLVSMPTWNPDSVVRNDFVQTSISVSAGNQYARIRFGYGDDGTPSQMFCTQRADSCVTDRTTSPYAFLAVDPLAPANTCTSGCTINVPALAGKLLYYRIERSTDGTNFTTSGDIQAIPIAPVTPPPSQLSGIRTSGAVRSSVKNRRP